MLETQRIERYIFNDLPTEERLLLDAKLLLDENLFEKVTLQKQVYAIVRRQGREHLKAEIEHVHTRLFNESRYENFRKKISYIFSK